ncbi:hypothetical protein MZG98_20125, partial [Escherichia coli]|nr:hypothetical protein [Escherichia coli]
SNVITIAGDGTVSGWSQSGQFENQNLAQSCVHITRVGSVSLSEGIMTKRTRQVRFIVASAPGQQCILFQD